MSLGLWKRATLRAAVALSIASMAIVSPGLRTADASVSIAIPFDDLVRESEAALIISPVSERVVWEDGRIITYTEAHVDDVVSGGVAGASEVWLRTRGGIIGHIGQSVEGEPIFTTGRPSLVFVRAPNAETKGGSVYVVTARAQGQFPVVLGADGALSVRQSAGLGERVVAPGQAATSHPLASDVVPGKHVEDAKAAVRQAWRGLHAG